MGDVGLSIGGLDLSMTPTDSEIDTGSNGLLNMTLNHCQLHPGHVPARCTEGVQLVTLSRSNPIPLPR